MRSGICQSLSRSLLLFAFCYALEAYPNDTHVVTRLAVSDALPIGTSSDLLVDSRGALWIRNFFGIYRFDGYRLQEAHTYDTEFADEHARNSAVNRLIEDENGNIWLGSNVDGLLIYSAKHRRFSSLNTFGNDQETLRFPVSAIHNVLDGGLWTARFDGSIAVVDKSKTELLKHIELSEQIGKDDYIVDFASGKQGALWALSKLGSILLCSKLNLACRVLSADHLAIEDLSPEFNEIMSISDTAMWVSTSDHGIVEVDTENFSAKARNAMGPKAIHATAIRNNNEYWLGSASGLFRMHAGLVVEHFDPSNSTLQNPLIVALEPLNDNALLASSADGIYIINSSPFLKFTKTEGLENTLISSFTQVTETALLVGSFGGLHELRLDTRTIRPAKSLAVAKTLRDSAITALESVGSHIWVGFFSQGLQIIEYETGNEISLRNAPEQIKSVACIEHLQKHLIAVCAVESGVHLFNSAGEWLGRIRPYETQENSQKGQRILYYSRVSDSLVAFSGYESSAFYTLHPEKKGLESLKLASTSKRHFSSLVRDSNNFLWVGSIRTGLYGWNIDSFTSEPDFQPIDTKPALPDRAIYAMEIDAIGMIWLSTNKGLVRLNPKNRAITIYDESDGLPDDEFNSQASFKDSQGYLYFGGNHGFVRFDPRDFVTTRKPPPLRLTEIMISNEPVSYDPAYLPPERLELDHNDHSLDFEFSTMDIISPGRSVYKYMLQGFDEDWIDIGRRNTATFTSLPAGDYIFRVIGANSDGVWNYDGISLPIRVPPAPWLTWWAFALYGTAALALLLLIKRYYDTHVLKEEATRQAKAMTATATHAMDELQDQLKVEQRLVGNLRRHAAATMDTISELLAMESEEIDDPLALDTMQRTRQRLQCLRALESGVYFHVDVLKVNFRDAVDSAFAGVVEVAPPLDCEIVLANECTDTLVPIDIAMPLVVLTHELLLNSVVHAFEGREGIECITVRLDENMATGGWTLEVADTGPGLPASIDPMAPTTLGMELINRVVEKLDAKLTYSGERGACFRVEVPGSAA